jgi:heme/copper-type cytochrome/quinol oxidase subunit 2
MEVVNTTATTDPVNMYDTLNSYIINPVIIIIIILIIVAYYAFSSSLGKGNLGNSNEENNGSNIFGIIIIVILVILILVNALQYFFSINVTAYIQGLFTPKTTVDIVVDQSNYQSSTVPEIRFKKQVFNIPGNYYNYDNAKALCTAYGADLATYDQIEKAYNGGAEWCNYGWSANQLALFPTQKNTYNNLQNIPGHENDCGRPGINGGYIANPNVQFGVNCYGYKPKITGDEEDLMKTSTPYPETAEDIAFQKKVDLFKNNLDEILVSPFNYNTWGEL